MNNAPLYSDIAGGLDGGAAHWVNTFDGVRIRVAHWTVPGAKATVLLFPGRTEYIEKYQQAAREFLARGFATVIVDWRGQGLSDRLLPDSSKGHVDHFEDYQLDVAVTLAHVKKLKLPNTQFLVAHSMGGAIGLRALYDGLGVEAAAFSAPMWGLEMSNIMRPFAWAVSHIGDAVGFGQSYAPGQVSETYLLREAFEDNTLTHDREMWETLKAQATVHGELCLGGPTLRWLKLALRECLNLSKRPSPATPAIAFLGTGEAIVDPSQVINRMNHWENGTLHMIQDSFHEPMMETPAIQDFVYNTIADYFKTHMG